MKSHVVGSGSILEDFTIISYDEDADTGRMLLRKKFDDGYVWQESVAIPIPDLFYLFKAKGIDPTEMVDESRLNFRGQKSKSRVGTQLTLKKMKRGCVDADSCYWQCRAVRV